jgi:mRNA-degrading endonuclease RelE of RelBE toxin-antitoxin system
LTWKIEMYERAFLDLKNIGKGDRTEIYNFIQDLSSELPEWEHIYLPRAKKYEKVDGIQLWQYRVSGYQIICKIIPEKLKIEILRIVRG